MQYFNHYSAPILAAVLLAGGLSLVLRRGGKMRQWLVLGGAMVALGAAWGMFRPVATPATAVAGLPWLLEVQSPYCLGCVAIKPAVDRLERELQGRLALRRVDIQSAEGRQLASQYGSELTPTFIFFDSSGQEQWRSVGRLDVARVRTSLQPLAKGAGNRHRAVIRPPARWDSCLQRSMLELRDVQLGGGLLCTCSALWPRGAIVSPVRLGFSM
ncbi:MAG: thioredoxin family protein [Verrucomicrobia bacterium]|nr:thioredoxin family protein [Verrucomicrobiota bacterium]